MKSVHLWAWTSGYAGPAPLRLHWARALDGGRALLQPLAPTSPKPTKTAPYSLTKWVYRSEAPRLRHTQSHHQSPPAWSSATAPALAPQARSIAPAQPSRGTPTAATRPPTRSNTSRCQAQCIPLTTLRMTGNSHFCSLGNISGHNEQIHTTFSRYLQHLPPRLCPIILKGLVDRTLKMSFPSSDSPAAQICTGPFSNHQLMLSRHHQSLLSNVPAESACPFLPLPIFPPCDFSVTQNILTNNQVLKTITHNPPVQLTCSPAHGRIFSQIRFII